MTSAEIMDLILLDGRYTATVSELYIELIEFLDLPYQDIDTVNELFDVSVYCDLIEDKYLMSSSGMLDAKL